MSKKSNTGNTKHGGLRIRPAIINEIHEQWCKDNGYTSNERLHQENTNRFVESASNKHKKLTSKQRLKHRGPGTLDPGLTSKTLTD